MKKTTNCAQRKKKKEKNIETGYTIRTAGNLGAFSNISFLAATKQTTKIHTYPQPCATVESKENSPALVHHVRIRFVS